MAIVKTDWVKTAQLIKEGKNLVVKKIWTKDGATKEIYASNATESDWVYEGSYDELENDMVDLEPDIIENEVDMTLEPNTRNNLLVEEYKDDDDMLDWYIDRQEYLEQYIGKALESDIYKFLGNARSSAKSDNWHSNSYLKGLGSLAEFKYVSEFTQALRNKLGGIPFRVIKRMFKLPGRINSWKDLKTSKGMDENMKGKIKAFKALHKGNSRVIEKGLKAIKNNKPLPKGLSERDIRKLVIIMVANSKKKGKK